MATPKTNKTTKQDEITTPQADTLVDNTTPIEGGNQGMAEISSATSLRSAAPSRLEIAATIASGLVAHGRYAALLRDERMIRELAANSLRVADALIAASESKD